MSPNVPIMIARLAFSLGVVLALFLGNAVHAYVVQTPQTLQQQIQSADIIVRGQIARVDQQLYESQSKGGESRICGTNYTINALEIYKGEVPEVFDFAVHTSAIGPFFRPLVVGDELLLLLSSESQDFDPESPEWGADELARGPSQTSCLGRLSRRRTASNTEGALLIHEERVPEGSDAERWIHYQRNITLLPHSLRKASRPSSQTTPEARQGQTFMRMVHWDQAKELILGMIKGRVCMSARPN